jgi:hypothetical protein
MAVLPELEEPLRMITGKKDPLDTTDESRSLAVKPDSESRIN